MNLTYLWAKLFKKARGSGIIRSDIDKTSKIESGSHVVNSKFGRHSFCGYDCEIINTDIGSFCSIANNVTIGGSQHPIEWVSTSPVFIKGKDSVKKRYAEHDFVSNKLSIIGNDVWIGEGCLIKQGVKIGSGSIIGMGSIVTKDIEPYSIVAGCPARLIRKRFSQGVVTQLLDIEWWNWNDEKIEKYAMFFKDPTALIKQIKDELIYE